MQLLATVRDQNGAEVISSPLTWSSSNTSVATVNNNGLVTAVGNGTTTITAKSGDASGTATITVP